MNKVMVTEMWTKEKSGNIKHEMFFNGYKPHNYFKMQRGEQNEQGRRVVEEISTLQTCSKRV